MYMKDRPCVIKIEITYVFGFIMCFVRVFCMYFERILNKNVLIQFAYYERLDISITSTSYNDDKYSFSAIVFQRCLWKSFNIYWDKKVRKFNLWFLQNDNYIKFVITFSSKDRIRNGIKCAHCYHNMNDTSYNKNVLLLCPVNCNISPLSHHEWRHKIKL